MKKIFISILILTLFLTGCWSNNNDDGAKKSDITLNVYNWGDFIDPDVINMFEE